METTVTEDSTVRVVIDFFSVIYSADWDPHYGRVSDYAPPKVRTLWQLTESDENASYTYDNMPFTRHRKWCAILSPVQFDEFINHVGLYAEDCETMGSLGAPGFGIGWAPAISFNSDVGRDQIFERVRHAGSERGLSRVRGKRVSARGRSFGARSSTSTCALTGNVSIGNG